MELALSVIYALIGLVCSILVLVVAIVVAAVIIKHSKITNINIEIDTE